MKRTASTVLPKGALKKELKLLSDWKLNAAGTQLSHVTTFRNHIDALAFIARVTVIAQVLDHHPDILFSLRKVKITISTKGAGGMTKGDLELAKRIETLQHA